MSPQSSSNEMDRRSFVGLVAAGLGGVLVARLEVSDRQDERRRAFSASLSLVIDESELRAGPRRS